MRWQMALYKEMAGKAEDADAPVKVVKRVQEVSAVLYHLEVVREEISCGRRLVSSGCPRGAVGVTPGSLGRLRRSIHSNQRRWCGTNCCRSRDAELLSRVSG